jgi:hypothetical protein
MQKQFGYVGQRKSDGKWHARVQVNGLDKRMKRSGRAYWREMKKLD